MIQNTDQNRLRFKTIAYCIYPDCPYEDHWGVVVYTEPSREDTDREAEECAYSAYPGCEMVVTDCEVLQTLRLH